MSLTKYSIEDQAQMRKITRELVAVLLPYRLNTEAALMCYALTVCVRTIARRYPPATRKVLLATLCAWLEGKTAPPDVGGTDPDVELLQ